MFSVNGRTKINSIDRKNARFARAGLRVRVTIAVVVPLVIILGLFTVLQYQRQRTMMLANLSAVADYSARVVEESLLYQMQRADFGGLQLLLDTVSEREELESVVILSTDRRVVFSSEDSDLYVQMDTDAPECRSCHQLPIEERPASIVVTNAAGMPVFRSMNLLENGSECVQCHEEDGPILGLLLTDIALGPVPAALNGQLRESLLWSAATILITIFVVNLVLDRFVLGRLLTLTKAVDKIDGDRQLSLPVDSSADEIGKLTAAFRDMAHRIEKRQHENQRLSERLQTQSTQRGELLKRVIQAQEAERKRIARELHDDLGQTMGGLALRAEVLDRTIPPGENGVHPQIKQIKSIISSLTDQIYDIILDLRPSTLDDLGLVPALRTHAQRLLEHHDLNFTIDGGSLHERLPLEVETTVFRVYQEALNNTVRHAQATKAHAVLSCEDGFFIGEFKDDGRGFDPRKIGMNGSNGRGLGLLGMQERILQCGGKLNIDSEPGNGTRITIWIPLREECYD